MKPLRKNNLLAEKPSQSSPSLFTSPQPTECCSSEILGRSCRVKNFTWLFMADWDLEHSEISLGTNKNTNRWKRNTVWHKLPLHKCPWAELWRLTQASCSCCWQSSLCTIPAAETPGVRRACFFTQEAWQSSDTMKSRIPQTPHLSQREDANPVPCHISTPDYSPLSTIPSTVLTAHCSLPTQNCSARPPSAAKQHLLSHRLWKQIA